MKTAELKLQYSPYVHGSFILTLVMLDDDAERVN